VPGIQEFNRALHIASVVSESIFCFLTLCRRVGVGVGGRAHSRECATEHSRCHSWQQFCLIAPASFFFLVQKKACSSPSPGPNCSRSSG